MFSRKKRNKKQLESFFEYEIVENGEYDKFDYYRYGSRDDKASFLYAEIKGFKEGKFIEDLIIPSQIDGYNVRVIGDRAFADTKIKSVTLPSSLVYISWRAFENCRELIEVKSVKTNLIKPSNFKNEEEWIKEYYYNENLSDSIFANCVKLKKVDLSKTHFYTIEYDNFQNTSIEEIIFTENSYYETKIGSERRNWNLPTLQKLVFPNLQVPLTLRYETFKECSQLKEVELPYNTVLLEEPFGSHTKLVNIDKMKVPSITGKTVLRWFYPDLEEYLPFENDTRIYKNTFKGSHDLRKVTISKNINDIGDGAFNDCDNLELIMIEEGSGFIKENIFTDSNNIKEIIVPSLEYFLHSPGLREIPTKITTMNKDLNFIELDNRISNNSFYYKDILTFEIPPHMNYISDEMFKNHSKLQKLIIHKDVKAIKYSAFSNCLNLEEIYLASDKANISWNAFIDSNNIKKIFLPNLNPLLSSNLYKSNAEYIVENSEFANFNVEEKIDDKSSLLIVKNVISTNARNVYELLKPTGIFRELKINTKDFVEVFNKAIENDYVEIIKSLADDEKLHQRRINQYIEYAESVDARKSLMYLTQWKNENVDLEKERKQEKAKAKKILIDPDAILRESFNFRTNKNYGLGATYKGNESIVNFPSKYKNENVVAIARGAFKENKKIEEVIVLKGVKLISEDAFYSCSNLKTIKLPSDVTIEANAFNKCSKLEHLIIDGNKLGGIGMFAFSYTSMLNELDLSNGVDYIDKYAFANSGLKKLILSNEDTSIGIGAFINCQSLVDITIPKGITQIQRRMFSTCASIEEIIIPSSVKKILTEAFSGCTSLKKIVIPESVKQIAHNSFEYCDNIILYVESGSFAHKYAIENNLNHVLQ